MKKKLVTGALLCAFGPEAITGGTLAYFTDTDTKENTFTVGNVGIHIDEWMKDVNDSDKDGDKTEWVAYADQKLSPIDNSKITNNKLVETVNHGTEDAYIRTFVTCPKDMYDHLGLGFNKQDKVLTRPNVTGTYNMYSLTDWSDVGTFTINGEETSVFLCEYKGIVKPGESVLSLTTVWLYKDVTNEILAGFDLTDGKFPVDVVSQAIQAENLTYDEAMKELGTIDQALMDKLFN